MDVRTQFSPLPISQQAWKDFFGEVVQHGEQLESGGDAAEVWGCSFGAAVGVHQLYFNMAMTGQYTAKAGIGRCVGSRLVGIVFASKLASFHIGHPPLKSIKSLVNASFV